jgi:hypothetical protein
VRQALHSYDCHWIGLLASLYAESHASSDMLPRYRLTGIPSESRSLVSISRCHCLLLIPCYLRHSLGWTEQLQFHDLRSHSFALRFHSTPSTSLTTLHQTPISHHRNPRPRPRPRSHHSEVPAAHLLSRQHFSATTQIPAGRGRYHRHQAAMYTSNSRCHPCTFARHLFEYSRSGSPDCCSGVMAGCLE